MDKGIERRIFILRLVDTTDLDKYTNKTFENDCFIDSGVAHQPRLSFVFAISSKEIFTSSVFRYKNAIEYDS